MKTKFRTLKDFNFEEDRYAPNNLSSDYSIAIIDFKTALRREAIKWVRWFNQREISYDAEIWTKHFFNLTKEDLK